MSREMQCSVGLPFGYPYMSTSREGISWYVSLSLPRSPPPGKAKRSSFGPSRGHRFIELLFGCSKVPLESPLQRVRELIFGPKHNAAYSGQAY